MNLLLCLPNVKDFEAVLRHINVPASTDLKGTGRVFSVQFLAHQADVCFTGETPFETAYSLAKVLSQKKYHLALYAGFAASWKPEIPVGEIVNVIREVPLAFDFNGDDLYEAELLNTNDFPHFKGGFVNMTNSYINVFFEFKKVLSATCSRSFNTAETSREIQTLREKYKADIETQNGIGFVYPCLAEKQPFYQIRAVERNAVTNEFDKEKAKKVLNETLIAILAVI